MKVNYRNDGPDAPVELYKELRPKEEWPDPGVSAVLGIEHGQTIRGKATPEPSHAYAPKSFRLSVDGWGMKTEMEVLVAAAKPSRLAVKSAREALVEKYSKYYPKTEEELYKAVV